MQNRIPSLFVYGTLAPGEVNEHILAPLNGEWFKASVRGTLHAKGWGQEHGFPALILDDHADPIEGLVFQSADLPNHWAMLDEFEGEAYSRVETTALKPDGARSSTYVYVLNERHIGA